MHDLALVGNFSISGCRNISGYWVQLRVAILLKALKKPEESFC